MSRRGISWSAVLWPAVVIAPLLFAWGFLTGTSLVSPESEIEKLARTLGLAEEPPVEIMEYTVAGRLAETAVESLPYADRSYDPDSYLRGVLLHDEARAQSGLNFYTSPALPAAFLVDMEGNLVYQWRRRGGGWQHAELLPNGHVVVIVKDQTVFEVDENSELVWEFPTRAHHDLWVADDGRKFVITGKVEVIPDFHPELEVFSDQITVLSPEGKLLDEISVYELVRNSEYAFLLPRADRVASRFERLQFDAAADLFHTNHVEGLDRSRTDQFAWYQEGFLLLSLRHLNAIALADLDNRKLVWLWGPTNLMQQHHPTILPNGDLLLFNNGVRKSEVLELDPRTRQVVWSYSDPDFFSQSRGSSFRLANGNTLITESDSGYVFEVTPEGEKVWVFANPSVVDEERAAIWRMYRLDPGDLPFLDEVTLLTD